MSISPARTAAFDILLRIERQDAYASELLHSSPYEELSSADHGLTTELVMGVLRWRSLLDEEIARVSAKKLNKLDREVLTALRLAGYQFFFLDRIPRHAAVHESVELVKRARKRSAAAFANAVLRMLAGGPLATQTAIENRVASAPPKKCLNQERESELDSSANRTQFRDTAASEIQRRATSAKLARQFAHPLWLVQRWVKDFGVNRTEQTCRYDQCPPETSIRLPDPAGAAELTNLGIDLVPGLLLASARRVRTGNIVGTRRFIAKRIAIQDEASQLVGLLVGRGSRILDCCAAPGGKTQVLAERNPNATIVALELHPHRTRLLRKLVPEKNVEVINTDVGSFSASAHFDCVLADVPCSGTGTLAHNPEIKWRLQPQDLENLQMRQLSILHAAMRHVAQGGRLVYSTCSLQREENEEVVQMALSAETTFRILDCRIELERLQSEGELVWKDVDSLVSGSFLRTIPGVHACDGFFAAILQKH